MATHNATAREWLLPLGFVACTGWLMWHLPAFILDWAPPSDQSAFDSLAAQHKRNDATPDMAGLFGGYADAIDWAAMIGWPVFLILGMLTVRRGHIEYEGWTEADRLSVFLGRVTMVAIALMVGVMVYEVFVRYVLEAPTLWANELSLWMAGFVFLFSGLYAMQQRSHIRIFVLYDMMPRWAQKVADTISTLLIVIFAAALVYGGWGEATTKFYRWETFGTAFDPPLPATIKPTILLAMCLVALQAVFNLIADWSQDKQVHTPADDIDVDDLTLGAVGDSARHPKQDD